MLIDQLSAQSNIFFDKDEKILTVCKYLCKSCTNPAAVILFGSYARGDNRLTSDLDILLLTNDEIGRDERAELVSYTDLQDVDLVIYTKETFKQSKCLLVERIKKEGVVLWEA